MKRKLIALQVERNRAHGRSMLEGIASAAAQRSDWRMELVEPNDIREGADLSRFDGFIVRVVDERMARALLATGKPVVDTYGRIDRNPIPFIRLDDSLIAKAAADHLLSHRFSDYGYCGFCGLRFSDARGKAFAAEIVRNGKTCSVYRDDRRGRLGDSFILNERADRLPDARCLRRWLKSLPKPVAVFCCNDLRAYQLLVTCQKCGLDVPHEVAILGVDNDALFCTLTDPPLSSVDTDAYRLGLSAAEMLDRMMTAAHRRAPKVPSVLHPPRGIVERASTEAYPVKKTWLSDALVFIDRHLDEGVSADDVAEAVGLSHTAVNRAFHAEFGRSVQKEIIRQRLERATRMLRETNRSAASIAAACGYASAQYFAHVFATVYNQTPNDWRKANA